MKTHEAATTTLFTSANAAASSVTAAKDDESSPVRASPDRNAAQPKLVEQRSTGSTALPRTLAFLAMS